MMSDDEILALSKPLVIAVYEKAMKRYSQQPEPRKPREWIVFEDLRGGLQPLAGHTGPPGTTFRVREVIEE